MPIAADLPRSGEPRFRDARRVQHSLTAAAEKKLLIWLATRTPRSINSDHLTTLGAAGQLLAGASYACASWNRWALLAASFFLAVNWLGDSLDGTLARVRNQQRPRYGFYVDHILDTFGALWLMGGLALSGYVHPAVAIAMLVAFLMLSVETYLSTHTLAEFRLSHGIFGPTEIRILLAIGSLRLFFDGAWVLGGRVRLFDIGGVIATACMMLMLIISTVVHTRQLYREETLQ